MRPFGVVINPSEPENSFHVFQIDEPVQVLKIVKIEEFRVILCRPDNDSVSGLALALFPSPGGSFAKAKSNKPY